MNEMILIPVNLKDPEHCINLLKLINAYMEDDMGIGESMQGHIAPQLISGLKKQPMYRGFFVSYKNRIIALANCYLSFGTFAAKPILNIHDLIVLPEFRRLGAGSFLLQKIENYALEEGCYKITLEVRDDNIKAKNLYSKIAFSESQPVYLFWEKKLNFI